MKHTLIAFTIALSLILTPFQGIHAQATTANAELIQKLLAQIVILQAELQKLIAARGGDTTTSTNANNSKTISSDSTPCTFTRTLREGTQGTDVTCLQTYLKKKGHFNGNTTGYYGPQTKDAVYKWQVSKGIVPEPTAIGMFGPRSQETLTNEMKTQSPSVTTNTTPTTNTPKTTKGGGGGGDTTPKTKTPKITDTTTPKTTDTPKTTTIPKTTTPVTTNTTPKASTTTTPIATVPKGNATIPVPTTNATTWNTLCAQSGIFVCDNFSDRKTGTIYPGVSTAYFDNGNLVFTIPTKSRANAGGEYRQDFSPIGEGKFIAFSYRIKADRTAVELNAPGRKEFILWRGKASCTDLQIAQSHTGYGDPFVGPYTECGKGHFHKRLPDGDYQFHYPDYDCKRRAMRSGDYSKCAVTVPDVWENYYIEVNVGTYGQPNSHIIMWKKIDGGQWKRYVDTNTFTLNGSGGFEHFMLTVYMTGKDETIDHLPAEVRYDHLIMSTKPFNADQFSALGSPSTGVSGTTTPVIPTKPTQTPASVPKPSTTPTSTPVVTVATATPYIAKISTPTKPGTPPSSSNPAGSLLSQIESLTQGQWKKITADNTAGDVDPSKDPSANPRHPSSGSWNGGGGFKAMFSAWNSGDYTSAIGPCGSILYFGGGHQDHWGNQIVGLNLCGGKNSGPLWQRLTNPYAQPITWPAINGAFPDGTPSPSHTYDTLVIGDQKLMIFDAQETNMPVHAAAAFVYDIVKGTWYGPLQHRGAVHGTSAWDSKRNLVWFQPDNGNGGEFSSFNPAINEFAYYGKVAQSLSVDRIDAMMGYDPVNDRLVVTSFRFAPYNIAERNPGNPSAPWVVATQVNKPDLLLGQHAMVWSAKRQAWIFWMDRNNDGKVWEVKRTAVNAGVPEYTWKLLTDASNTVIPSTVAGHNGSYGKFQLVTVGNDEVLIGQLVLADGIYAFKIPAPGVATKPTNVPLTNAQSKTTLTDLLLQLRTLQEEVKKLKQ